MTGMATMFPARLRARSILSPPLGAACSSRLSVRVVRHPRHMTVTNLVRA